jgi:hypothetical protein
MEIARDITIRAFPIIQKFTLETAKKKINL